MPTDNELSFLPDHHRKARIRSAKIRTEANVAELKAFSEDLEGILALKGPHDLENSTGEAEWSCVTITSKSGISGSHCKECTDSSPREPGRYRDFLIGTVCLSRLVWY